MNTNTNTNTNDTTPGGAAGSESNNSHLIAALVDNVNRLNSYMSIMSDALINNMVRMLGKMFDIVDDRLYWVFRKHETAIAELQAGQQQQQSELADMKRTIAELQSELADFKRTAKRKFDDITMSCEKRSESVVAHREALREALREDTKSMKGTLLLLSDIAVERPGHFMTRFQELLPNASSLEQQGLITPFQHKSVDYFISTYGGKPSVALRQLPPQPLADMMLLTRDVSSLAQLKSLGSLLRDLGWHILAVETDNKFNAAYLVTEACGSLEHTFATSEGLPCVGGANYLMDITVVLGDKVDDEDDDDDDDGANTEHNFCIMARTAEEAAPLFGAILQLAAKKASVTFMQIDIFSAGHMSWEERFNLPLPEQPLSLERPFVLDLNSKVMVSSAQQAANLVTCFSEIICTDLLMADKDGCTAVSDGFVSAIAGGKHALLKIKCKKSSVGLTMNSNARKELISLICRKETNVPKLVFDGSAGWGVDESFLAVIGEQIASAIKNDKDLSHRLGVTTGLRAPFKKMMEDAITKVYDGEAPSPSNAMLAKLVDDHEFPIDISSKRKLKTEMAEKIIQILAQRDV